MKKTILISVIFVIFFFTLPRVLSACSDADVDGWDACVGGIPVPGCDDPCDCHDGDADINPGHVEVCADGKDNDCDTCTDTVDSNCGGIETSCTDNIDNDCDTLKDCNDPDCNSNLACLPKIFYDIIGLGFGSGQSSSYKLKFAMPDQPIGIFQNSNFKLYLGHYHLIYHPQDNIPPVITILSPQNATYYSNSTPLTFTINKPTTWIKYSLDGTANKTITGNIIMNVTDGSHNVIVYTNDTSGDMGSSQKIYFTNDHDAYLPWETSYITSESYPAVDIELYNNKLYLAANDKLYVFDGNSWNQTQAPINTLSLQNFSNKLYVTGNGGKIYSYDGNWTEVFNTNSQYAKMLGVYNNTLYVGTYLTASPAKLYYCSVSCDNPVNWHQDLVFNSTIHCPSYVCSIDSMVVNGTKMYVSSGGNIYRYDGAWTLLKNYTDVYSFNDMKVYNNKLYFATRDQSTRCPMYAGGSGFCGRVIEYNGTNWNEVFNHDYWIYSLEVYHNKLYAGTANKIYKWNGTWQVNFNSLEGAQYAMALKTWNDKIYVGFGNGVMFKDDLLEITTTTSTTTTSTTSTTTTTVKTTTTTRPTTTTTKMTTTTIKSSCSCTAWRMVDGCCSNGKGKWVRTCTPKGCQAESKCEGPCAV